MDRTVRGLDSGSERYCSSWEMGLEVMGDQQDYRCPSWIELVVPSVRRFCPLHRAPSSAFLNGIMSCYALCVAV